MSTPSFVLLYYLRRNLQKCYKNSQHESASCVPGALFYGPESVMLGAHSLPDLIRACDLFALVVRDAALVTRANAALAVETTRVLLEAALHGICVLASDSERADGAVGNESPRNKKKPDLKVRYNTECTQYSIIITINVVVVDDDDACADEAFRHA